MSQAECMVDVFVDISDQRGVVLQDIYNKDGNDQYRFYYHDPHDSASRWLHYLLLLFCHAPLGVHSTIRRHQPPQRMVLGQVNCIIRCEIVGSQTVIWGRPGGLFQLSGGGAVRIVLPCASSCVICRCVKYRTTSITVAFYFGVDCSLYSLWYTVLRLTFSLLTALQDAYANNFYK